MKLKICTTGNIFGKICLKAIRDTFFQYVICNQGSDGVKHEEMEGGRGEGREDSVFW